MTGTITARSTEAIYERRSHVREVMALYMTSSPRQIVKGLKTLGYEHVSYHTVKRDIVVIMRENIKWLNNMTKSIIMTEMYDRLRDLRETFKTLHTLIENGKDPADRPLSAQALATLCHAQDSKSAEIRECEAEIELYHQ